MSFESILISVVLAKLEEALPRCKRCGLDIYNIDVVYESNKIPQYNIRVCNDKDCPVHWHCHS